MRLWSLLLAAGLVVAVSTSIAFADDEESTEDEATEETAEDDSDDTTTEELEEEETGVELDCNGADLAEFTNRVTRAAENHGVAPPPQARIAEVFRHADHNNDGRIGPREAHRLARHADRPPRAHARVWRHRIICRANN